MAMSTEHERLVSVQELAEYLGVKVSWVYGRTSAGTIPHVKVGRYVRFRIADVERWLERKRYEDARVAETLAP